MKIYIVGSGGVGGYFGGLLAKAGNDVTFVARGKHYEQIRAHGLKIKSVLGNFVIKPASVIDDISKINQPDLIFFSVKTYDSEKIAKELTRVITKETIIISFQNGVNNDFTIKKFIKSDNIYPGVVYVISAKTQPGTIEQTGGLRSLIFGDRNHPPSEKLKNIEKLFKESGINATLSDDISRDIWKKFMLIVAFSGITAICRSSIGKVLSDPDTKSIYEKCVQEAIKVAKAFNINVPDDAFDDIMKKSLNTVPNSKSSLLLDIENNRKNEIESLNGMIVKLAKEKSIDVPINKTIYCAIKLLS